jgi:hypothetical protein
MMVRFGLIVGAVLSTIMVEIAASDYSNYGYSSSSVYGSNYYADTQQTYYDGYAQAWRYLGWYVDCNGGSNRYYDRSQHSHSGDNSNNIGNNYCQRYLMWAAVSWKTRERRGEDGLCSQPFHDS